MAHHFILLRLNPFGLRVDGEGWWFVIVPNVLKTFPGPGYLHSEDGVV